MGISPVMTTSLGFTIGMGKPKVPSVRYTASDDSNAAELQMASYPTPPHKPNSKTSLTLSLTREVLGGYVRLRSFLCQAQGGQA